MSEAVSAPTPTAPQVTTVPSTETPALEGVAIELAPEPVAPTKASRSKARDLAGKFLSKGGAKEIAAEKGETPAGGATDSAIEAKAAAALTEAKPVVVIDAAAEKRKAEDEANEKSWREIHRRKKQQREQRAALEADRLAVAADKQRFATWQTEQAADEKLKQDDPPAWLEKHRFDFRDVALREVQKQQLTPEQKADKAEKEAIRAELAAERAARERLEKETLADREEKQRARAAEASTKALSQLHDETKVEWSQARAEFPTLAAYYTPEEIAEAATQVRLDHYRKTRIEAPLDDVFDFMEKNALREHTRFSRQATAERTERDTVVAEKATKTRAKVGPPVTNQVSATRASPPKPLTADEKRAAAVARAAEVMGPRH